MPDQARVRRGGLAAAALAIASIAALAWRMYPRESEAPPAAPAHRDALVLAADPGVERRSAGGWAPARSGDSLRVTDSIRTGEGSTAEIELGPGTHVTLAERSEVTVRELTAAVQRVGILRGWIGVDLRPDGTRVLRVEDPSGKVAAFGTSGRFGVLAKGEALAVASTGGQVTVESGGGAVKLPAGAETVARSGDAPLPPRAIPREVVLRVARQIEERRASVCLALEVDAASELSVNGEPVEVPRDGKVVVRLPPHARRREIDVTVRHASGVVERKRLPCWQYEGDVSDLEVRWNAR
jgi:hypothetical protein